jgi:hypothetical protein
MNPNTRACIAYVAGRLISKKEASSVTDFDRGKILIVDGEVQENKVEIYDFDSKCNFCGEGKGNTWNLYDYGGSHNITLKISAKQFEGYDYGASCNFSGDVDDDNVSLHDYGESKMFLYNIS